MKINENEYDKALHYLDLILFPQQVFEFYKRDNFKHKIMMQFKEKIIK